MPAHIVAKHAQGRTGLITLFTLLAREDTLRTPMSRSGGARGETKGEITTTKIRDILGTA